MTSDESAPAPAPAKPTPAPADPIPTHTRSANWKKSPPARRIETASINKNNLGTVKKINSVVFPISYSAKFYEEIMAPELEDFNRLVYYNDVPVGSICCRLDKQPGTDTAKLYIATMAVLAAYRSLTIGHQALALILSSAASHSHPKLTHIYVHVQVSNDEGRRFYEREGFSVVGEVKDYYKKITPPDAWVMEVEVGNGKGKEREKPELERKS